MAKGKKTGGRQKGTPNKLTASIKTAVLEVFNARGGVEQMTAWASQNETAFYMIASKLIPHEVVGPGADGAHLIKSVLHVHEQVKE